MGVQEGYAHAMNSRDKRQGYTSKLGVCFPKYDKKRSKSADSQRLLATEWEHLCQLRDCRPGDFLPAGAPALVNKMGARERCLSCRIVTSSSAQEWLTTAPM